MRHGWFLPLCAVACDGGGLAAPAPPDSCGDGHLVYADNIHVGNRALGGGDHSFASFTYSNGTHWAIDITDRGTERVHLDLESELVIGEPIRTRGFVQLDHPLANDTVPYDFGNCETDDFSGVLTLGTDVRTYQFTIEDLHAPPYCTGSSITGGFAACYRLP